MDLITLDLPRLGLNLATMVPLLPHYKGVILTLAGGKEIRHSPSQLHTDVCAAQKQLHDWGIGAGFRVGIHAENSYQWLVFDLALMDMRAVSVPFTNDFIEPIGEDTLARYGVSLLLVSSAKKALYQKIPPHIAFLDADNGPVQLLTYSASESGIDGDILSLAFSSGSAGGLKGLVISRSGVEANLPPIVEAIKFRKKDRLLLFLPMSNFQQRLMCYAALWYNLDLIITDHSLLYPAMKALSPTALVAPPMFYRLVHTQFVNRSKGMVRVNDAILNFLDLVPFRGLRRWLARLVFPNFYAQFGPRMRTLITGMAPVSPEVGRFFAKFKLPLCETYGLIETGPLTFRDADSKEFISVGQPLRDAVIKLAEDGEIIVYRRRLLTSGYFQAVEGEQARTFIGPNCVATGDIGRFDSAGNLHILGRKRELLVTSSGYKVHPEVIERDLTSCPDIFQAVIFLRPNARQVTCVLTLANDTPVTRTRVKALATGLDSARKIGGVGEVLYSENPFTCENGMLRPNMKLDRRNIVARYGTAANSATSP